MTKNHRSDPFTRATKRWNYEHFIDPVIGEPLDARWLFDLERDEYVHQFLRGELIAMGSATKSVPEYLYIEPLAKTALKYEDWYLERFERNRVYILGWMDVSYTTYRNESKTSHGGIHLGPSPSYKGPR